MPAWQLSINAYFSGTMSVLPKLIKRYPQREKQLLQLQACALACGMDETVKWGIPTFTFQGKNILSIAAFKSYAGIWFFEGALLTDKEHVLVNAQEGKTKMQWQWRFSEGERIPERKVKAYMQEAMRVSKRKVAPSPPKETRAILMPIELQQALLQHAKAAGLFEQLPPSHRKAYITYVAEAKQIATRKRRADKCITLILEKKGLYEKYR